MEIPFSSSSIVNSTIDMYTHVYNPTSTTASTPMKIVASFSITFLVCCIPPHFFIIIFTGLTDSDGPVQLELPEQWLWDIVDEFIYQFQVFCTWRSKVKSKTEDEITMLAEGGPVSTLSILECVL